VSTPAKKNGSGISGQAGVTLNDWVTVDVKVTPQDSGDIVVNVICNGRPAIVTFQADGGVDMDVEQSSPG
jgi:hypothetical protein